MNSVGSSDSSDGSVSSRGGVVGSWTWVTVVSCDGNQCDVGEYIG